MFSLLAETLLLTWLACVRACKRLFVRPEADCCPLVQGPNKVIMTAVGALAAAQLAFLPAAGACLTYGARLDGNNLDEMQCCVAGV